MPYAEEETSSATESVEASGFGLPLLEQPRHYENVELTDRPAALDALPEDLGEALPPGGSGQAILLLEIDEKGAVISITPENSDISPDSLDRITKAFKEMRFLPGRVGKSPVKTRMRIEVTIDDWRGGVGGNSP